MELDYIDKEYEEHWKHLGEIIGYTEDICINCGRRRVEKYKNGPRICEKCSYDQDRKEYDHIVHKYT